MFSLLLFSAVVRFQTARATEQALDGKTIRPGVSDGEKGHVAIVPFLFLVPRHLSTDDGPTVYIQTRALY